MADGEVVYFSYGAVVGLIQIADEFWTEIDGACARSGVDPFGLPFHRFLNLVYTWSVERLAYEEGARADFDDALFTPMARGTRSPDNVSPEVVDEEMALFRAASTSLKTEMMRG